MKRLLKKIAWFLAYLWAAGSLVFFLVRTIPADLVVAMLGRMPSTEDVQRLQRDLHLDEPLARQYVRYVKKMLALDFGESMIDHRPVANTLLRHLPNTAILAFAAMLLAAVLAVPLGILSSWLPRGAWNIAGLCLSAIGLSIPGFLLGLLLILLFAIQWRLLPISGSGSLKFLILPACTLAIPLGAFLQRVIHTTLAGELRQPYVLLARAKGLGEFQLFHRHVMKNALIPIITISGLLLGALLGGTMIIENIFSWPGIGTLLVTAIRQRDFPMIQGTVFFMAAMYLLINLLVDLTYPIVNPRIRHDG